MTTTNRRLLIAANRPVNLLRKFTFDRTAGNANISTCTARIKRLRGNTIVWNQLVQNGNFANWQTGNTLPDNWTNGGYGWTNYGTISKVDNGIDIVFTSALESGKNAALRQSPDNIHIVKDHYYYTSFYAINDIHFAVGGLEGGGARFGIDTYSSSLIRHAYLKKMTLNSSRFGIQCAEGFSENNHLQIRNFILIDLTQMFGAGHEPTSVEEFEKLFPLDYYEYNAGELLSFNGDSIKAVGFNQWDGTYEANKWISNYNGSIANANGYNLTGYIPVLPNTTYYKAASGSSRNLFYDANKDPIEVPTWTVGHVAATFTSPSNARYIRFSITSEYLSTFIINLSNPSKNGTYEPYVVNTKDISFYKSIKDSNNNLLFSDGSMHSAGDAYDEAYANKARKVILDVDMGDLNWAAIALLGGAAFRTTGLASIMKQPALNIDNANIICAKYETKSYNETHAAGNTYQDKSISGTFASGSSFIDVCDNSYSSAADFKAAMQGVHLYVELAEPIEVDIEEQNLEYPAYRTGTEELLPANGAIPTTTPALFDIRYKIGGRRN